MAAESDLYTALTGASPVTDIVSARIYADVRDQEDDVPAIFFQRTDTNVINTIHGNAPCAETASMLVVCFENTRELAETLANAVTTAAITAGFLYTSRRGEYSPDLDVYATILQFTYNEV
jgi:hypothetical protein